MAAFGVFYSVSRLFALSRRLRLSLVIVASVLTTAHQLLVHWYFELPTVVYYITAFFTNLFFYILPLGLGIGIYLVIKLLLRDNNTPLFPEEKKDAPDIGRTGADSRLKAHSMIDAVVHTPAVKERYEVCQKVPDTRADNSSAAGSVTVEHFKCFNGEEMIIKSSDEGTEVSFNPSSSALNSAPTAVYPSGPEARAPRCNSNVSANIPTIAVAAVDMFAAHNAAQKEDKGGTGSLLDWDRDLNRKQCELPAQIKTTIDSTRYKNHLYRYLISGNNSRSDQTKSACPNAAADSVSGSATDTAIGAVMMSPFAQERCNLEHPVVHMDKENRMAVIEADDNSDNSHVLIITNKVPASVRIQARGDGAATNAVPSIKSSPAVPVVPAFTRATESDVSLMRAATSDIAASSANADAGVGSGTFTRKMTFHHWEHFHWRDMKRWTKPVLGMLQTGFAAAVCISVYSTWVALALPEVNEVNVSLDIPAEFDGLDLFQLSDFQNSPIRRKDRAAYIYNKVLQLHPSLVVITGDFELERMDDPALQPLMRMNVPYGVYTVGADSSRDLQYEYYRLFDNWNYSFLSNSIRSVKIGQNQLNIIGISTEDAKEGKVSVLHSRKVQEEGNKLNILLSNSSSYAEGLVAISQNNIDLMLVGKSQDRTEPLLTDYIVNLNRSFISGLFRPDKNSDLLMYVSSGTQVPDATPGRLGSRTEITHITIYSTQAHDRNDRMEPEQHTPVQPLPDNIDVNDKVVDNTFNHDYYRNFL